MLDYNYILDKTKHIQEVIKNNPNLDWDFGEFWNIEFFYQELVDCLLDHNDLYYNHSTSLIGDLQYDKLFDFLKKVESNHPYLISVDSPTQWIKNQLQEWFEKARHSKPMLSLENSYNVNDLSLWNERLVRILDKAFFSEWKEKVDYDLSFFVEPKFDGVSIELIYKNGIFVKGITRGDGRIGEDVTQNIKQIKTIPNKIESLFSFDEVIFRWEIMIAKSELNKINKQREIEWLNIYSNTRNLASGSLKQLDTQITKQRNLLCYIYESYWLWSEFWENKSLNIYDYMQFGFNEDVEKYFWKLIPNKLYQTFGEAITLVEQLTDKSKQSELWKLDIDLDWLVLKAVDVDRSPPLTPLTKGDDTLTLQGGDMLRDTIWGTAHHPRWAIAYKFPAKQVKTTIKTITYQVGRTGIITPVAELESVELSGAKISRVSLHNFDFIAEKGIFEWCEIWLQRSGEVIPYVVWVVYSDEKQDTDLDLEKIFCPSCNWNLENLDWRLFCRNLKCPAQIKEKIIHFVSRDCMNIEGIGDSIVDVLVEHGIVKDMFDLYKMLDFEVERVVSRFPGFANKKIFEIKSQLEKSKNIEFWRFINGLWISWVGKKIAQDIEKKIGEQEPPLIESDNGTQYSIESLFDLLRDEDFLIWIEGIWEKIVEGVKTFFVMNKDIISKLKEIGFNFIIWKKDISNKKWNFAITWSFDFSRNEIIAMMEKNWYEFDPSPKKTTNFVLIWNNAGSKKQKADNMRIRIIEWWETIVREFEFLTVLKKEEKNIWPVQGGLF